MGRPPTKNFGVGTVPPVLHKSPPMPRGKVDFDLVYKFYRDTCLGCLLCTCSYGAVLVSFLGYVIFVHSVGLHKILCVHTLHRLTSLMPTCIVGNSATARAINWLPTDSLFHSWVTLHQRKYFCLWLHRRGVRCLLNASTFMKLFHLTSKLMRELSQFLDISHSSVRFLKFVCCIETISKCHTWANDDVKTFIGTHGLVT